MTDKIAKSDDEMGDRDDKPSMFPSHQSVSVMPLSHIY